MMNGKKILFLGLIGILGVSGCAKKPPALTQPEPLELYQSVCYFYDSLLYRDLDSFADKDKIRTLFQGEDDFNIFLDSILPAMWERKFERNRILDYQIRAIELGEDEETAWVKIWILSDDTYPFGKIITFSQRWYLRFVNWYPAEIKTQKATFWEKFR